MSIIAQLFAMFVCMYRGFSRARLHSSFFLTYSTYISNISIL
jgi:hypothetical protein